MAIRIAGTSITLSSTAQRRNKSLFRKPVLAGYLGCCGLILSAFSSTAQVIPVNHDYNFTRAGLDEEIVFSDTLFFEQYFPDPTGTNASDASWSNAMADIQTGVPTVVKLSVGTYLFNQQWTIDKSIYILGEGNDQTIIRFDLGGQDDMIRFQGSNNTALDSVSVTASKHSTELNSPAQVNPGDWIFIDIPDVSLVTSAWATGSVGQIVKVQSASGGVITLDDSLRHDVPAGSDIYRMNPLSHCGLACLKLERLDASTNQTSNILFNRVVNFKVSGVVSEKTNFSHVEISRSAHGVIEKSFFHDAHAHGAGGQGYGVTVQFSSGNVLVQGNNFSRLRHSMLLQAGPNGNVFAYNNSPDVYWDDPILPADAAGDIVCHGNYPYANLFEGNVVQNLVIDNSHGINGPGNVMFRNRVLNYGVVMNNNSGDDMVFIGNEVPNTTFLKGLFTLNGTNFEYGNNLKGTITPAGTGNLSDESYAYSSQPNWYTGYPDLEWPPIGPPLTGEDSTLTQLWYADNHFAHCGLIEVEEPTNSIAPIETSDWSVYPNPVESMLTIGEVPLTYRIYSMSGVELLTGSAVRIDVSELEPGVYLLKTANGCQPVYKK